MEPILSFALLLLSLLYSSKAGFELLSSSGGLLLLWSK